MADNPRTPPRYYDPQEIFRQTQDAQEESWREVDVERPFGTPPEDEQTSDYTCSLGEFVLLSPQDATALTVVLPIVTNSDAGRFVVIKQWGGLTTDIHIDGNGATIDREDTLTVYGTDECAILVVRSASEWIRITN